MARQIAQCNRIAGREEPNSTWLGGSSNHRYRLHLRLSKNSTDVGTDNPEEGRVERNAEQLNQCERCETGWPRLTEGEAADEVESEGVHDRRILSAFRAGGF